MSVGLVTFKAFVVTDLTNSVIVHDRYQNYDSAQLGTLVHQLCCAHLLRDLDDAAQVYPDAVWPVQIADALRGLIHHANLAREQGLPAIDADTRDELLTPRTARTHLTRRPDRPPPDPPDAHRPTGDNVMR